MAAMAAMAAAAMAAVAAARVRACSEVAGATGSSQAAGPSAQCLRLGRSTRSLGVGQAPLAGYSTSAMFVASVCRLTPPVRFDLPLKQWRLPVRDSPARAVARVLPAGWSVPAAFAAGCADPRSSRGVGPRWSLLRRPCQCAASPPSIAGIRGGPSYSAHLPASHPTTRHLSEPAHSAPRANVYREPPPDFLAPEMGCAARPLSKVFLVSRRG